MAKVSQLQAIMAIATAAVMVQPTGQAIADTTVPEAAQHLPPDLAYLILLDTRDETWQQLEQYALVQQLQAEIGAPLDIGGLPFLPTELDYQTDVAPWLGDTVAVALMPLDTADSNLSVVTALANHEVLIAPIAQSSEFSGFVETVSELRGTAPAVETYQTIDILYWQPQDLTLDDDFFTPLPDAAPTDSAAPPPFDPADQQGVDFNPDSLPVDSPVPDETIDEPIEELPAEFPDPTAADFPFPDIPGLAIAVLPDVVVAAENPVALRTWFDQRPETATAALATDDRFLRTLAHPEYDGALGMGYGNLSEMIKYSLTDLAVPDLFPGGALPPDIFSPDPAQLAALDIDSSIEVLIYPTAQGIRVQGRAYYDDPLLQNLLTINEPAPQQVIEHIPGNSYGLFSSQDWAAAWQEAVTILEAEEDTSAVLEQARSFFSLATGLDLDQDVFSWMDQGFSVFLFPTEDTPLTTFLPGLDIGLGVALQTSDRATAEATLAQLDQTWGTGVGITVETQATATGTISSWQTDFDGDGQLDSFFGHGWASDDTLILTSSLGSLSSVLELEPAQALPNALRFLGSTEDFPADNQGYVFANLAPVRALAARFFPVMSGGDPELREFSRLLGSLKAISGTLAFEEDYLQLDGMVMLAPATVP
ncbi:MAG: DUF3352 domain-containing protein, partial [Cyanobacteria bacterium P01_D01_bin.115]